MADIRILIVADQETSSSVLDFGSDDFGLSELLAALASTPATMPHFVVTKAHRGTQAADIPNFRFDNPAKFDPSLYDEIWLFGISRTEAALSPDELKAVTQFMDHGGGLFAVGDHQDLGNALCGQIPRVRSMRKWSFPAADLNGQIAPPVGLAGFDQGQDPTLRHDTLREGEDAGYQFDDQSDDIPQPIQPKWYPVRSNRFFSSSYPHPLLCGPNGAIKVLPDHMHEGECIGPDDISNPDYLTRSVTFAGYTTQEFPTLPGSSDRLAPEVIARATVIGGHTTDLQSSFGSSPATQAQTFGVLGAYDGHKVNIGRVAVDATWHHFININIRGVADGITAIKEQGYAATPDGQKALDDIKAYWRNIGVWLAPKHVHKWMFEDLLWQVRWRYPLVEELPLHALDRKLDAGTVRYVGDVTRNLLTRMSTKCLTLQWLRPYFERIPIQLIADPWWWKPDPPPDPVFDAVINSTLGAMVLSIARAFPSRERPDREKLGQAVASAVPAGLEVAHRTTRDLLAKVEQANALIEKSLHR